MARCGLLDAVVAWFAEGLQEGGIAGRLECSRLLLLVDAPLADESVLEDLARSEGQASSYGLQCQRGRHDCCG